MIESESKPKTKPGELNWPLQIFVPITVGAAILGSGFAWSKISKDHHEPSTLAISITSSSNEYIAQNRDYIWPPQEGTITATCKTYDGGARLVLEMAGNKIAHNILGQRSISKTFEAYNLTSPIEFKCVETHNSQTNKRTKTLIWGNKNK